MNHSCISLEQLNGQIIACRNCRRLVEFREKVAREKRKQFMDWNYWGRPVPGYGDANPKLILVGLAPAAHGGNRTGRVFTGDKSAEFLMKCLYDVGLANQPNSDSLDDGLQLNHVFVTAVLKCAPPRDRPTADELHSCAAFFERELALLGTATCVLALGRIAFDGYLRIVANRLQLRSKDFPFGHGHVYALPDGTKLVGSYHPSPRNVNTGRLSYERMISLLRRAKELAGI